MTIRNAAYYPDGSTAALKTDNYTGYAVIAAATLASTIFLLQALTAPHLVDYANDIRQFWAAGSVWLSGHSPYGPEYSIALQRNFPELSDPFFYPPAALPYFALYGALPPELAVKAFYLVNAGLVVLCAAVNAKIATTINPKNRFFVHYALNLIIIAFLFKPTLSLLLIGAFALHIAAAFLLFAYALLTKKSALTSISLAVLLIKPQLGLIFFFYCLCQEDLRRPAIYGALLCAATNAIGIIFHDPVASIAGFFDNISRYSSIPWNLPQNSAGLGYIGSFIGVTPSAAISIVVAASSAVIVNLAFQHHRRDPHHNVALLCLFAIIAIATAPNHVTDFTILFAGIPLFLSSAAMLARILIAYAILALGQIHSFIHHTMARDALQQDAVTAMLNTGVLILYAVALLLIVTARATPEMKTGSVVDK